MRQYRMIVNILLILPIINFAFALPIAVQEVRQLRGDVVPNVAITMSTKRDDKKRQLGMYFERLSGNPESDLAGLKGLLPFDGLHNPPQMGTSEIQQVSSEPSKSPSLDHDVVTPELLKSPTNWEHYILPPEVSKSPSMDHYMLPPELLGSPTLEHYMVPPELPKSLPLNDYTMPPTASELGPSLSAAGESGQSTTSSLAEKPISKSFLSKAVSKIKLWRRISSPSFVRDAVNVAQRELQGLVVTGAYVFASSPDSQTF